MHQRRFPFMGEGEVVSGKYARYTPVFLGILFAFGLLLLGLLFWQLGRALLVVFFALVLGILLSRLVTFISRYTRLPRWGSLLMLVLVGLILAVVLVIGIATPFWEQFQQLSENFPTYIADVDRRVRDLSQTVLGREISLQDITSRLGEELVSSVSAGITFVGSTGAFLGATAALVVFAIFVALAPDTYHHGFLKLFPDSLRAKAARITEQVADAMAGWGFAKALSMFTIAFLSTIGFAIVGVPSFLVFGIVAGLLSFIPFLGTALGIILPALVLAAVNPARLIWIVVVWAVVQFIEGNIVVPLALKRGANVPEALEIIGLFVMGTLAGFVGILTADPLLAAGVALVNAFLVHREPEKQTADNGSRQ